MEANGFRMKMMMVMLAMTIVLVDDKYDDGDDVTTMIMSMIIEHSYALIAHRSDHHDDFKMSANGVMTTNAGQRLGANELRPTLRGQPTDRNGLSLTMTMFIVMATYCVDYDNGVLLLLLTRGGWRL